MATTSVGGRGDAGALLEQMKHRLERGPHAALGIAEGSSPQTARAAFLQLTKAYHPAKFAREAPEVVRQANEVFLALRAAYETITGARKPPMGGTGPIPQLRSGPTPKDPVTFKRPTDDTPTQHRDPPTTPRAEPPTVRRDPPHRATPGRGVPVTPQPVPPAMTRPGSAPMPSATTRTGSAPIAPATTRPGSAPIAPATTRPGSAPIPQGKQNAAIPRTTQPIPKPQPPPGTQAIPQPQRGSQMLPSQRESQPIAQLTPGLDAGNEEAELESAMQLLRRKQWTEARKALHVIAARIPADKRYRALLSYARGREAQDLGRHDEARTEFGRALQLDPELNAARAALSQVAEEPDRPAGGGGGLFSKLFKK